MKKLNNEIKSHPEWLLILHHMAGKIKYKNGGHRAPWSKTQDGTCTETKITFISESAIVISFVVNGGGGALYAVTYN